MTLQSRQIRRARNDAIRPRSILPPHYKHGTRGTYNRGCGCGPCRDAEAAYWHVKKLRRG